DFPSTTTSATVTYSGLADSTRLKDGIVGIDGIQLVNALKEGIVGIDGMRLVNVLKVGIDGKRLVIALKLKEGIQEDVSTLRARLTNDLPAKNEPVSVAKIPAPAAAVVEFSSAKRISISAVVSGSGS